jgi:hypothetical protein
MKAPAHMLLGWSMKTANIQIKGRPSRLALRWEDRECNGRYVRIVGVTQ